MLPDNHLTDRSHSAPGPVAAPCRRADLILSGQPYTDSMKPGQGRRRN
jgi:hypothetical protein